MKQILCLAFLLVLSLMLVGCGEKQTVVGANVGGQKTTFASNRNDFPVTVAATLSQGMYFAMVQNGIDSSEYVVDLRISNIGSSPVRYKIMRVHFINPTTEKGLTTTTLKTAKDFDIEDDQEEIAKKSVFLIKPHSTNEHRVSTNGYTYDILTGMSEDENVRLVVEFIDQGDKVVAAFGTKLPGLVTLPHERDQSKKTIVLLTRIDE